MKIRIAIADDHPMIIKGLQNMLVNYPDIGLTGVYADGEALMEGLARQQPDVLLLDIQLPGHTGDELAPVILKKYPETAILMLTNLDSTLYVNKLLRQGVLGYLMKTTDEETLIRAVRTVHEGGEFLESTMQEKLRQMASRVGRELRSRAVLTPREKEILQLIADGYTGREIAAKLNIGFRTVENYRLNILLKLDVKNTAALIKKALKQGLVE